MCVGVCVPGNTFEQIFRKKFLSHARFVPRPVTNTTKLFFAVANVARKLRQNFLAFFEWPLGAFSNFAVAYDNINRSKTSFAIFIPCVSVSPSFPSGQKVTILSKEPLTVLLS